MHLQTLSFCSWKLCPFTFTCCLIQMWEVRLSCWSQCLILGRLIIDQSFILFINCLTLFLWLYCVGTAQGFYCLMVLLQYEYNFGWRENKCLIHTGRNTRLLIVCKGSQVLVLQEISVCGSIQTTGAEREKFGRSDWDLRPSLGGWPVEISTFLPVDNKLFERRNSGSQVNL